MTFWLINDKHAIIQNVPILIPITEQSLFDLHDSDLKRTTRKYRQICHVKED